VARDFRVGTIRTPEGELDHVVVTFLIDPEGRIAERYLGTEHSADEMLADLERVLRVPG
jgi:cytochrome oxidase Cu insertion factor (SCO1/SenC/PrrC family)